MSDEDIDLEGEEVDLTDIEEPVVPASVAEVDTRRLLEKRLEEARLRKMTDEYDFD